MIKEIFAGIGRFFLWILSIIYAMILFVYVAIKGFISDYQFATKKQKEMRQMVKSLDARYKQ